MTSALESTEMPTFGNILHRFSTIFQSLLSLRQAFSAFTVVSHLVSIPWTKSSNSIGLWKYLTKVQFAIFFGLIQTIDVAGVSHQEVQATPLARIFLSSSIIQMISSSLQERISSWWTDTIGLTIEMSSQSFLHLTIVIDAEMRLLSWKSTSSWNTLSYNLTQLLSRMSFQETSTEEPQTTSCEYDEGSSSSLIPISLENHLNLIIFMLSL